MNSFSVLICFINLFIFSSSALTKGTDDSLPKAPFWNGTVVDSTWIRWLAGRESDRCGVSIDPKTLAVSSKQLLDTASSFPGAHALHTSGSAAFEDVLSRINFDENVQPPATIARMYAQHYLSPYGMGVVTIVAFIIFIVMLFLMLPTCRSCCSMIWCKVCCGARSRPHISLYGDTIRKLYGVGFILFVIILPLIFGSLVLFFGSTLKRDVKKITCSAYQAPSSLIRGIHHDQNAFQDRSGVETRGLHITHPFEGAHRILSYVVSLQQKLAPRGTPNSIATTIDSIMDGARAEMKGLNDKELVDLKRLTKGLSATEKAIQAIPNAFQTCPLCISVESGPVSQVIAQAEQTLDKMDSHLDEFTTTIQNELNNNPQMESSRELLNNVVSRVDESGSIITNYFEKVDQYETYPDSFQRHFNQVNIAVVLIIWLFTFGLAVGDFVLYLKAWHTSRTAPIQKLKRVTCGQWIFLLFSAFLFFLFSTLFLFPGFIGGQACNTVEKTFLTQNSYHRFPKIVSQIKKLAGLKDDEATLKFLQDIGTFKGSGRLNESLGIDEINKKYDDAVNEVRKKIDSYPKEALDIIASWDVQDIATNVTSFGAIILIDYTKITDPTLIYTYPEVLISGIQKDTMTLDEAALKELSKIIVPPAGQPIEIFSTVHGISAIQDVINAAVNQPGLTLNDPKLKHWCLKYYDACDGPDVGTVLIGDAAQDLGPALTAVENAMQTQLPGTNEAVKFRNAVLWASRKLSVLAAKSFVVVDEAGVESNVRFEDYLGSTTAFVPALTTQVTQGFISSLHNVINGTTQKVTDLLNNADDIVQSIIAAAGDTRSLLAVAMTVVDPMCRGVAGDTTALAIVWCCWAATQWIAAILLFKAWHYCVDKLNMGLPFQEANFEGGAKSPPEMRSMSVGSTEVIESMAS